MQLVDAGRVEVLCLHPLRRAALSENVLSDPTELSVRLYSAARHVYRPIESPVAVSSSLCI
jgi:hypothetical protein